MNRRNRPAGRGKRPLPSPSLERIYGVHAVRAALANPRRAILALYATKNGADRLSDILSGTTLRPIEVSPGDLTSRLGRDAVHQGVLAEAEPLAPVSLEEAMRRAAGSKPVIVLDQVTDPHNVGAILRSAAAFGASALVMTRRNSPPLDGALAKAASGAVDHVPVVLAANLARALGALAESGVQRIGLDSDADAPLELAEIRHPCALVLGAEHKGLRRLTRENCDAVCRLTVPGPLRSLNVSNAAAVALHVVISRG